MVMQEAINVLVEGGELTPELATQAMETMVTGAATGPQIGAFLAAHRMRGFTAPVVAAGLAVMLKHAEQVPVTDVIDLCGTGGDGADTFNASTAAGLVVAAAGVRVAKHGNRAASSKCGSADLLEAMGARLDLTGPQAAAVIEGAGFCFLFAQRFHPAMRHVGPARREIGIKRTLFNIVGPLSNPANPRAQLVGVGAKELGPIVAETLRLRGMERGMVVHSHDGLDEFSPAGPSTAWLIADGRVEQRVIRPRDFGIPEHPLKAVAGGDAEANKTMLIDVLSGQQGPIADFVTLQAAAALHIAGAAPDLMAGTRMAREVLQSGLAKDVLYTYIRLSNEVAE